MYVVGSGKELRAVETLTRSMNGIKLLGAKFGEELANCYKDSDIYLLPTHGEGMPTSVLEAMAYSVAKEVGARAVALKGKVDAIIVTGGIAHSDYFVSHLSEWISFIAPIVLRPGEDEVSSLAYNALGALNGRMTVKKYHPVD